MAVRYISVADVRAACGIQSTLVSDADMTLLIEDMEYLTERDLNTSFSPVRRLDRLQGRTLSPSIRTIKNPLLAVRGVRNDTTAITLSTIIYDRSSGKISLDSTSSARYWCTKIDGVKIDYWYAWLNLSQTVFTTTDAAEVAGTAVVVAVASATGITQNAWVWIEGLDGKAEAAKVSSVSSNNLTLDQLNYPHEAGSIVTLLERPAWADRLMIVNTAIAAVARVVGASYTDIVGYTYGKIQVQKGEPYTQWRETAMQLVKERDKIMASNPPRIAMQ